MTPLKDRLKLLRGHATVNGIDFVEIVDDTQEVLDVHFVNPVSGLASAVIGADITGGDAIPEVRVLPIASADWVRPDPRVLRLRVDAPGDFSRYTLTLRVANPLPVGAHRLDPRFDHAVFSFKAGCCSSLDCAPEAPAGPVVPASPPRIEYLAKDFHSFRGALLEFSHEHYQGWVERSEADFGVMFLEALASAADDLSYFQDRVAAEAYLGTATERRSLVRLARLVDYEPRPATAARVLLRVDVPAPGDRMLVAPIPLRAQGPDGAVLDFEVGTGMDDRGTEYRVRHTWSAIAPYWWDDSERYLRAGSTSVWLVGDALGLHAGQQLLLDTAPLVAGDPLVRALVTLTRVDDPIQDPLQDPPTDAWVTRVAWSAEDALVRDHDLTRTTLCANLVPATQGREVREQVTIGGAGGGLRAIVRTGPNGTPQYLHTLRDAPLAWLGREGDAEATCQPEIKVSAAHSWAFRRSLLDAGRFDEVFAVDPVRYRRVGEPLPDGTQATEYDGRDGDTIRFGDGTFGVIPAAETSFAILYRVGGGAAGNVAAGTTFSFDAESALAELGASVDNPFPAAGGSDAESDEAVRQRAPHAFRRRTRRAPLAGDYDRFARELPWVQRSSTTLRHTGTWLAAVTAPDPLGVEGLSADRRIALVEQLDRVRLAGRESLVRAPRYAPLDLRLTVCVRAEAFDEEVRGAILSALGARVRPGGALGFFHPDRFSFGQGLSKADLEAAVQRVPGVHGVVTIQYRIRNLLGGFQPMPAAVAVNPWEIIQVDSNPSRPERGSVTVTMEGGK